MGQGVVELQDFIYPRPNVWTITEWMVHPKDTVSEVKLDPSPSHTSSILSPSKP